MLGNKIRTLNEAEVLRNLEQLTYPDVIREERTYDKIGQLLSIRDKTKDGTIITDLPYTYDLSGNIIQTSDGTSKEEEKKLPDTEVQESADEKVKKISYEEDKKISDGEMKKEDQLSGTDVMRETTAMEYDTSNRLIFYNGEKVTYDREQEP